MLFVNILLFLIIFLILSDLYIKNSPKSKLVLVPINYKIKKKDDLNEIIIDIKKEGFTLNSLIAFLLIQVRYKSKNVSNTFVSKRVI